MTEISSNPVDAAVAADAAASAPCDGNSNESGQPQAIQNYTDGYAYEVPRPFLTLAQAAQVLGMTLRSIERSVQGRWGSTKLPDGWVARRMKTAGGDEWRILPPPGFRVKLSAPAPGTEYDTTPDLDSGERFNSMQASTAAGTSATGGQSSAPGYDPLAFYSPARRKQTIWRPERHTIDQPTIVIDRTEEVEHLLRELLATKSALAEERRLHMEDLRMITQLQSSMRLLEVNHAEQQKTRAELEAAKQELNDWKQKYHRLINTPWWRRLFSKTPQP
jgi:hypothetical protein